MNRPTTDLDISSPQIYSDEETLVENFRKLRQDSPVVWVEQNGYRPFWAITKNADIRTVSRRNDVFINAPRLTLIPSDIEDNIIETQGSRTAMARHLLDMDDPEHRAYRNITQKWFNGPALGQLEDRMNRLATEYIDRLDTMGGQCDFAEEIASEYPLTMITSILGLPETDNALVKRLTQEIFGAQDPEVQRSGDFGLAAVFEFFGYLTKIMGERREQPQDDLFSVIVNAQINDEALPDIDALSYAMLIATAGHDTTSSSLSGGIHAFSKYPDQLALLNSDPSLVKSAAQEIFRWASPVKHFMRTATEDFELRGQTIKAGEAVGLMYYSANRDEDEFENPDQFDIRRTPNRHLAFGFGVHHCLGRVLAEMEVVAFFSKLAGRLERLELSGEPQTLLTNHTGGFKSLPISYDIRPVE